uniref:RNA-dependent RNA polymerase n=1 Tax=Panagrolaimus sp. PS1159 TaxID=55785 RepID=A0AC35GUX4_9BILA
MTVLSKNIYPQYFELHNVFPMEKLVLGSIINRQAFAPTYFINAPKDENDSHNVFAQYLDEQRDLQGVNANMLICFEHDRESLTVCFPDILKNWTTTPEQNNRSPKRVVDIRVEYSAIRRVIVSMENYDQKNNEFNVTFTFQLNYPPTIKIYEMFNSSDKAKTKFKQPFRFLTWNKGHDIANSMACGSCLVADCLLSEARSLLDCLDRLRKSNNYAIEFRFLHRKTVKHIKDYNENPLKHVDKLPNIYEELKKPQFFPLVYAVQALITRGGEIFDYFFRPEYHKFSEFFDYVIKQFTADLKANPGAKIAKTFFIKLYSEPAHRVLADITDEFANEGYMRVRKIIVTPTRKIFINPELIMGNRSLRKVGADNMLRVVFRDDNNQKVSQLPDALIKATVTDTLMEPMNVGFRNFSYLCSSNSQLRDHGCYFMAGSPEEVAQFRFNCGKFKTEAVSKMMSRMGQCFTQARQLGIEIERDSYSEIFDFTGGA